MNNNLKKSILKSLEKISIKQEKEKDLETKFNNILDIANLVKIIESYEELEPDIKKMLNKKAYKDKWGITNEKL